jgi:hypothetical protein
MFCDKRATAEGLRQRQLFFSVIGNIRLHELKPMIFYIAACLDSQTLYPTIICFLRNSGIFILQRWLIAVILAIGLTGCSEPVQHDDDLARERAIEFADVALVKHDFDGGYALLSKGAKSHVTVEKFRETLSRLHPDGYPTRITSSGSKPMFNEKAIYVYLSGEALG